MKKPSKSLVFVVIIGLMICCLVALLQIGDDDEKSDSEKLASISEEQATEKLTDQFAERQIPTITKTALSTKTPTLEYKAISKVNSNVRSGPGLDFTIKKVLKVGEEFKIYGRTEDSSWLLIDPLEQLWINNSVITVDISLESFSIAPTITPTLSPTVTNTITPKPTATLVPAVSILEIYNNLKQMTELQFKEYKNTLVGKPVREKVKISNVQDDGKVTLSGKWSPFIINIADFGVVVLGVPHDIAIQLNGGDEVYLEATIDRIVGDHNYFINRENVLVLKYKLIEFP